MTDANPREDNWALALALAGVAALVLAPFAGHVDDVDAQTYLVIARNLARDRAWTDLRFVSGQWTPFREHLPFGFWPAAAAIRLFGESSVPVVYAAMTLGAVAAAAAAARVLRTSAAAIAAVLLLGTCESIWHYGARPLLEPPLLLFTSLSLYAWARGWLGAASAAAALAVLVKGPFGLLPLFAVIAANPRGIRLGAIAALAGALVPAALFLVLADASWREGYIQHQLFASATGARTDGVTAWWFPLRVVAGRFWPGLPFVALGAWAAFRGDRALRTTTLGGALIVALLCIPSRKWGNHAYVAFPLLAIAGAVWAARLRVPWRALTAVFAAAACAFAFAGGGKLVLQPPCDFSTMAARPKPGTRLAFPRMEPLALAEVAAEWDVDVVAVPQPDAPVLAPLDGSVPEGFREAARGAKWKLLVPAN